MAGDRSVAVAFIATKGGRWGWWKQMRRAILVSRHSPAIDEQDDLDPTTADSIDLSLMLGGLHWGGGAQA